jgi:hypothetical protein
VTIRLVFPSDTVEQLADGNQQRIQETPFETQVLPSVRPKIVTEPEARPEEVPEAERKERRLGLLQRPVDISAAVEAGRISLLDVGGTQVAVKALAEYAWEGGLGASLTLGYQTSHLDAGQGRGQSVIASLGVHRQFLDGLVKLGGLFTGTWTEAEVEDVHQGGHSVGPGVLTSFQKDLGPLVLSGGMLYQFLYGTGDLHDTYHLLSYGLGVGVPVGRLAVVNLEAFQINDLQRNEDPLFVGASITYALSRRWGLTLGWKTVLHVEGFSSQEGTLGASTRF